MNEDMKHQILRFVADLKKENERIVWEEVAERVKAKFPQVEGLSLTANAVKKRYNAWLRESEGSHSSDSKKQEAGMMSPQAREELRRELMLGIEDYVEEYVKGVIERVSAEVAERVFQEKISYLPNVPTVFSTEVHGYPLPLLCPRRLREPDAIRCKGGNSPER